jgi:hypothetical protein
MSKTESQPEIGLAGAANPKADARYPKIEQAHQLTTGTIRRRCRMSALSLTARKLS